MLTACIVIVLSFVEVFANGAVMCSLKTPVPSSLDPELCTHGIYGFFTIKDNAVSSFNYTAGVKDGMFKVFELKDRNPNLKILPLLWIPASVNLKELLTNSTRYTFLTSLLGTLQAFNYDGVLVASQAFLGKSNMVIDRKSGLKMLYSILHSRNYLVVNILPNNWEVRDPEELVNLNDSSDLIFLNLATTWSKINMTKPQHPHALFGRPEDESSIANLNSVVTSMISNGMDSRKIVLPVHFFGHRYMKVNVAHCDNHQYGTKTDNVDAEWRLLQQDVVCALTANSTIYWDNDWNAPYICRNMEVIYYENEKSLAKKLEYIGIKGLGGIAVSTEEGSPKACYSNPFWFLELINDMMHIRDYNQITRQPRSKDAIPLTASSGLPWYGILLIVFSVLGITVTAYFAFKLVYLDKRPTLINQPGYRFMTKNSEPQ